MRVCLSMKPFERIADSISMYVVRALGGYEHAVRQSAMIVHAKLLQLAASKTGISTTTTANNL